MEKSIDEITTKIRKKSNINENDYVDVIKLAKDYGIIVGNAYLPREDGYLVINSEINNNQKIIGVNMTKSLFLKRFIVAYALGLYYIKENNEETCINKIKLDIDNIDFNIAYFATSLLVPKLSFNKKYKQLQKEGVNESYICDVLSKLYKVPIEVIKYRKDEMIQEKHKTNLSTYYQHCENKEIDNAIKTIKKIKKINH